MLSTTHRRQPTTAVLVTNRSGRQLRWAFIVALAITLLLLQRAQTPWLMQTYTQLRAIAAPVAKLVQRPGESIASAGTHLDQWWYAQERNRLLEVEYAKLMQWQRLAQQLNQENTGLRALLAMPQRQGALALTAKIIGTRQHAAYRNTIVINRGTDDGVTRDALVVSADGIVGRVVSVEARHADLIRLTDPRMRLPVQLPDGQFAIATGNGSKLLHLDYSDAASLQPGAEIMTSRAGSVVQAGISVGKLVTGAKSGSWYIQPYGDASAVDFVQIVAPPLRENLN